MCNPTAEQANKNAATAEQPPATEINSDTDKPVHTAEKEVNTASAAPIGQSLLNQDELTNKIFGGALNTGPTLGLESHHGQAGLRCSSCQVLKPRHQSWAVHNTTEDHIKHLFNRDGTTKTVSNSDRRYSKVLSLQCDLCDTEFQNILHFNEHKLDPEHRRRKEQLLRLVRLAADTGSIERWNSIKKPGKHSAKSVSKVLKYYTQK